MSRIAMGRAPAPYVVSSNETQPRVTPRPASERFRDALVDGAGAVLQGVEQVAGLAPGVNAVSVAVRGASAAGGTGGAALAPEASSGYSDFRGAVDAQATSSLQLLELQQQISMEQRQFTTVSNVLKTRHETAKNVINNVR